MLTSAQPPYGVAETLLLLWVLLVTASVFAMAACLTARPRLLLPATAFGGAALWVGFS